MNSLDCDVEGGELCSFEDGTDVLDYYALDESNFWFDIGMLFVLIVGFRFLGYLCIYYKARRTSKE